MIWSKNYRIRANKLAIRMRIFPKHFYAVQDLYRTSVQDFGKSTFERIKDKKDKKDKKEIKKISQVRGNGRSEFHDQGDAK
jgi:hypothetical protein